MKKSGLVLVRLGILVFLLLSVCARAEVIPNGDDVVADDGTIKITREDIVRYIQYRVPEDRRAQVLSSPDSMNKFLQNLYMIRSLASLVDAPEHKVNMDQVIWESYFNADSRLSEQAQEAAVTKAKAKVDWDAYAQEIYIAEPKRFMIEARVDVAHILISTEERSEQEAAAIAKNVREKALKGEDFIALAKTYSDDQSGAELGAFTKGKMVKEFEAVAFAMQTPGGISEIVKTQFGFHIIKLNKQIPAEKKLFQWVKPQIIGSLNARIAAQARDQLLTKVRSVSGVDINKELLESIKDTYTVDMK